jgi:hypothetical protein
MQELLAYRSDQEKRETPGTEESATEAVPTGFLNHTVQDAEEYFESGEADEKVNWGYDLVFRG